MRERRATDRLSTKNARDVKEHYRYRFFCGGRWRSAWAIYAWMKYSGKKPWIQLNVVWSRLWSLYDAGALAVRTIDALGRVEIECRTEIPNKAEEIIKLKRGKGLNP